MLILMNVLLVSVIWASVLLESILLVSSPRRTRKITGDGEKRGCLVESGLQEEEGGSQDLSSAAWQS